MGWRRGVGGAGAQTPQVTGTLSLRERSSSSSKGTARWKKLTPPPAGRASASSSAERHLDDYRELSDAVKSLATDYRTVVVMRYYDGLEPKVIAEKLGRHRSTIFREIKRNTFVEEVVPDLRAEIDPIRSISALGHGLINRIEMV